MAFTKKVYISLYTRMQGTANIKSFYFDDRPKNLLQKQADGDKKAFPVILGPLKRELQEEAFEKCNTMHGIIRIILALHVEKNRIINTVENIPLFKLLPVLNSITVDEVADYMKQFRENNKEYSINNIDLIKICVERIVDKRVKRMERKKVSYSSNKKQLQFGF